MRLEPLSASHEAALAAAASDGRLWELWFTSVPEPDKVGAYIATALDGQAKGHMLPWVVRELETDTIVGHDALSRHRARDRPRRDRLYVVCEALAAHRT